MKTEVESFTVLDEVFEVHCMGVVLTDVPAGIDATLA